VAEIGAALDWLAARGPAQGINGPIVLSGWSAGGHLTAMCLRHPLVRAGLTISGLFELGPVRDTGLNERLRLTDQEIATLSPLRLPVTRKPPCDRVRDRRVAVAGLRQQGVSRGEGGSPSAGGAGSGAGGEPLYHYARVVGWRRIADTAVEDVDELS
jgi:hypothetical protein